MRLLRRARRRGARLKITLRRSDGVPCVDGILPGELLALLITDDIQDDLEDCESVLAAIAAVRAGRQPRFERSWNATHLLVQPDGAWLSWAARISPNVPVYVPLDELEAVLVQLRDVVLGTNA